MTQNTPWVHQLPKRNQAKSNARGFLLAYEKSMQTQAISQWRNVFCIGVAVAGQTIGSIAAAAPLALASVPQGRGGREPAPNIILSVDDSGSMGSTGMTALRNALTKSFSTGSVADDSIRLGYQAMWRCRGLSATPYDSISSYTCKDNRLQYFSGAHRTNFNSWVNALSAASGTPSHSMFANVHNYMQTTGVWSPFASKPGVTETPLLTCRKTFHIFMTDGGWKDTNNHKGLSSPVNNTGFGLPGNADGTTRTLPPPDNMVYEPYGATAAQVRAYRDPYSPIENDLNTSSVRSSRGTVSTLADWAFHMWATDYSTIANELKFKQIVGQANYGTPTSPYLIDEYWNPKNNPMKWQGVTTYTIGFNAAAAMLTSQQNWKQYTGPLTSETLETVTIPAWGGDTWAGGLPALVRGEPGLAWPNPLRGMKGCQNGVSYSGVGCNFNSSASGREFDYSLQDDGGDTVNNGTLPKYGGVLPGYHKIYDLWHAAINGRGKYIPATDSAALEAAFKEIVDQIIADSSTPITSISASTQSARSDTWVFTTGYESEKWNGDMKAFRISATGAVSSTHSWSAAAKLDALTAYTSRRILAHDGTKGVNLDWTNLSTEQKTAVKSGASDAVGLDRINHIRGDRSKEQAQTGGTLRTRASRLGDVVNSVPWSVGKPNMGYASTDYQSFRNANTTRMQMVYVGSNNGLMHGFSAADGEEKLAYMPRGFLHDPTDKTPNARMLTDPNYSHRYFVDGKVFTTDFQSNSTTWKTALVGTLAGGGRGYFVLDVTAPGNFSSATAENLVLVDTTATSDTDIGYIYSPPVQDSGNPTRVVQIAKLNNNRWALLLGNGINSKDEKPVLLIQYLDGSRELIKIYADTTAGDANGLSHPQVIDLNSDGKADIAYAGDIKGNLWKFDLTSSTPSNWKRAFAGPLFTATDTANNAQPITTAPAWALNTKGRTDGNVTINLLFGTGRDVTTTDPAALSQQTIYSVQDNTWFTTALGTVTLSDDGTQVSSGRSALQPRTTTGTITGANGTFYKTSTTAFDYTGTGAKRGWYFDYPQMDSKPTGERTLANPMILEKRLVMVPSLIPGVGSQTASNQETCTPNATPTKNYLTILDITTGLPYGRPLFDNDGGGFTGSEIGGISRFDSGKEPALMISTNASKPFESSYKLVDAKGKELVGLRTFDDPARLSWRQLQ